MANGASNLMERDFQNHKRYRSCLNVFRLPYDQRCEYAKSSQDCLDQRKVVNFIQIFVCDLNVHSFYDELKIMIIFVIIMLLFSLMIAIIADKYFAPALKVVARLLHMNEHLAGVTLLAFGNSSADLFSNLISDGHDSPIFSNTLAGALIVTMVSGGLTCYMSPFKLNPYCIVRDLLFFIAGALAVEFCVINQGSVNVYEASSLLVLYVYYIIVILVDQFLLKKHIRDMLALLDELENRAHRNYDEEYMLKIDLKDMIGDAGIEMKARKTNNRKKGKENTVNEDSTRNVHYVPGSPRNRNLFSEFFEHIVPLDPFDWQTSHLLSRILLLVQSPIHLFCLLFIPHVDLEENKHGWSKLLNCVNIVMWPSISAVLMTNFFLKQDFIWRMAVNPKYFFYPMPVSVPLAVVVFLTSRTDLPPKYHWMFSFMSITASMFVIFICAAEISEIMSLLCKALNFSEDFMGATIGAFASSVGDLVINFALTSHGYGQMAFAAALGGPFFEVLFITGLTFLIDVIKEETHTLPVQLGLFGHSSYVFLQLALFTMLLWCMVLNFRVRRSVGVFSIVLYLIFLIMTILVEGEIIHAWADDKIIPLPTI